MKVSKPRVHFVLLHLHLPIIPCSFEAFAVPSSKMKRPNVSSLRCEVSVWSSSSAVSTHPDKLCLNCPSPVLSGSVITCMYPLVKIASMLISCDAVSCPACLWNVLVIKATYHWPWQLCWRESGLNVWWPSRPALHSQHCVTLMETFGDVYWNVSSGRRGNHTCLYMNVSLVLLIDRLVWWGRNNCRDQ